MGDTGVLVAAHLGRRFDVVGVSTRPALVSGQEVGNRIGNPDHWRRNFLVPLDRFRRLDGVRLVHGAITEIDVEARTVDVAAADGRRVVLPYDVLVIASGVSNGFWRQPRVEAMADIEAGLGSVAARIDGAGTVAVVGGGATGVSAAFGIATRHPTKDVHLFLSGEEPLPGYHPRVRRHLTHRLEGAGVHLHPGHRAALPDGFRGDELTAGPVTWSTGQAPFDADLVVWAVGAVTPNTGFVPPELLDDGGFVRVDEHLRVPGHPEVFAIGDVAATDPNRCSARNFGYRVLVHNLEALDRGREDRLKRFVAPEHRWGSILGLEADGMTVYQANGSRVRVPRWAVQPVLFDLLTKGGIYGGGRRRRR